MISMPRLKKNSRVVLLLATLSCASLSLATAQKQRPVFKPGEMILYCQPGTPQATVQDLANKVNAEKVEALLLPDCYKLVLGNTAQTELATTDAVAKLKADGRAKWVGVNNYDYPAQSGTVEPNDPRYKSGEMWGLKMIRMPQAWALQKGGNITVAVIDSGFNVDHEDLRGQFHSKSRDHADNDDDIRPDPPDNATDEQLADANHGTHVAGTIIAKTNNGLGVAGICWENVKCFAMKGIRKGGTGFIRTDTINAAQYIVANADEAKIKVLNMSLGGLGDPTDTSSPYYAALKNVTDKGIILVVAAGNETDDSNKYLPAGFPFALTVAALGPSGDPSSFSNFGKIELAAPGGEQSQGGLQDAGGILSTVWGNNYAFFQGTSMASPHVAGVAGLVMSTSGVTAAEGRKAMFDTANRQKITSLPDRRFGYGVVDAGAAVARVSVRVEIQTPVGLDALGNTTDPTGVPRPVETLRPTLRFRINRVPLSASDQTDNLKVTIDGRAITRTDLLASVESGVTTGDNIEYVVALRMPKDLSTRGEHTLVVEGTNPTTNTTTRDTRRFTITPHDIPAGVSMISIPFYEGAGDSPTNAFREIREVLGQDTSIYRWIYLPGQVVNGVVQSGGKYAQITPEGSDLPNNAQFRPTDTQTTPGDNTSEVISPVGLAYFVKTKAATSVITYGLDYSNKSVRIPIHEGWNMIGDPYNYAVSFNTLVIEDKSGARYTAQQAADNGVILPYIYRFLGGEYEFQALPNGVLAPWEGHWIYVIPKSGTPNPANVLTLIVQPVQGGAVSRSASVGSRAASTLPRISGSGSWTLRLEARTNTGQVDTSNYIGTTTRAATDRLSSVPEPPKMSPYVSLGFTKADAPNGIGLYSQDLQPAGGVKTWDMVVNTDQADTDVTLSWPEIRSVPRNVRLTLTDKATGQTIDLRQRSSFRFNTGRSVEPRLLTVTAKPSAIAGRALITNLMVNPVRASNGGRSTPIYEINYSLSQDVRVEMSILSASGKTMATVGNTRAATVGDNRAVWNGRDNAGRDLPAGMYVLQVRAITGEGEMTRSVTSFLLTR